ncbi:unnamed protein product [Arctogadus glacialis]
MSVDPTRPEPVDFTLDESKLIFREIAKELDRILQMLHGQTAALSPCSNGLEENRGEACNPKPEEDKRLKKAIGDLSTWTWTLRGMEDESVCLDTDVDEVVKEMCKQWKKGKLPNILPVLDFVILSILQQEGQKLIHNMFLILISKDRRSMKMDRTIDRVCDPWRNVTRTKHQYDGWWCVLGREGFASGKHYWEVDVRGMTQWRMGVLGQLMAMTVPVTKLARCAPSVLGVFLDMEEGYVSFYDVRNRFHIYSFNVSFDLEEKIFPVFGTVETGREMRILN